MHNRGFSKLYVIVASVIGVIVILVIIRVWGARTYPQQNITREEPDMNHPRITTTVPTQDDAQRGEPVPHYPAKPDLKGEAHE